MTEKTMKKIPVILMIIALLGVLLLFGYDALLKYQQETLPISELGAQELLTQYFEKANVAAAYEMNAMSSLLFVCAVLAFIAAAMGSPVWLTVIAVPVWGIGLGAVYYCSYVIHSPLNRWDVLPSIFMETCCSAFPALFIIFVGLALAGNFIKKGFSAPFFSMALMGLILYWYYNRSIPGVMTTFLLLMGFGIIAIATAYLMFTGKNSPIKAAISWAGIYLMPVAVILLTNLWVDFEKEYTVIGFVKSMFTGTKSSSGFPPQTVFTYLSLLLLIFGLVIHTRKPKEEPVICEASEEETTSEEKSE